MREARRWYLPLAARALDDTIRETCSSTTNFLMAGSSNILNSRLKCARGLRKKRLSADVRSWPSGAASPVSGCFRESGPVSDTNPHLSYITMQGVTMLEH